MVNGVTDGFENVGAADTASIAAGEAFKSPKQIFLEEPKFSVTEKMDKTKDV